MLAAGVYAFSDSPNAGPMVVADQAPGIAAKTFVIEGVAGETTIVNRVQAFEVMGAAGLR